MAVFDHCGRLVYSNPGFTKSRALSTLIDGRGFLTDPDVEAARREAVHHGPGTAGWSARTVAATLRITVEVIPLRVAPEWTALLVQDHHADTHPDSGTLTLSLLLHELRGPLGLAQESLETLTQLAAGSGTEVRSALDRQARSISRLTGLLQGLGDLSRAYDLSGTRHGWTKVDLAAQVLDVADVFREPATARGHELVVAVETGVPEFQGHADLLWRAIANLVDNALKYSVTPGPVTLSLSRRGALAVVEVADTGPGIAPADHSAIFDEFQRLPAARAAMVPGSGLGLAVARRIAEAHGGRLSLESRTGAGSAFRLTFLLDRLMWSANPGEPPAQR
ncbi:MAG TPA: HAMP domain-containing sensor histidine kinase [Candidatus Dormibacteraeota bacterium]|nr:HAMP domain-containing sensor histidine kinase [Candidatus Dormibacteraeota bacterium]